MPFIKSIVGTKKRALYYLLLSFTFAIAIPSFSTLANDFGTDIIAKGADLLVRYANDMTVNIVLGYTGYFVLGYLLDTVSLSKTQRLVIYALGIFGFAFTVAADSIVAIRTQRYCGNYYGYLNFNVLLEAVAVFTLLKHWRSIRTRF